jgi:hypothetical protein
MLRSDSTKWANVMVIKRMNCKIVFLFTQTIQIMMEANIQVRTPNFDETGGNQHCSFQISV